MKGVLKVGASSDFAMIGRYRPTGCPLHSPGGWVRLGTRGPGVEDGGGGVPRQTSSFCYTRGGGPRPHQRHN